MTFPGDCSIPVRNCLPPMNPVRDLLTDVEVPLDLVAVVVGALASAGGHPRHALALRDDVSQGQLWRVAHGIFANEQPAAEGPPEQLPMHEIVVAGLVDKPVESCPRARRRALRRATAARHG